MKWVMAILPLVLMLLGFPIYIILLATTSVVGLLFMDVPLTLIPQIMFGGLDKFALLAVPFFIFAGEIMSEGGISKRIVHWLLTMVGGVRGGVAFATVGACEFFGAVSGSSPATVAAIGRLMYPALRKGGYDEKFSLGLITSSGALASVMPPSIVMIIYGASAEQSIAALFAGGVLPALLIGALTATYIMWTVRRRQAPDDRFSARAFLASTKDAVWALGTPLVILGGIYLGIFSPTEAAGVAGMYGIFVTMLIYREVDVRALWRITINSAQLTGQILIIVAASGVFSWLLTVSGIPQALVAALGTPGQSHFAILLLTNIFLLVVGCFIDPVSAIIILTPLLVPLMKSVGVDLVHFGIILTVNLSIGMFTPPFGLNIFVSQAMFNVRLPILYRGLVPFIIVQVIALLLVTYVPAISLTLADLVRK